MDKTIDKTIETMTGISSSIGMRLPSLNELTLNGSGKALTDSTGKLTGEREGGFYRLRKIKDFNFKTMDPKEIENEKIGVSAKVIFLSNRMRLAQYDSDGRAIRQTVEFTSQPYGQPQKQVALWLSGSAERKPEMIATPSELSEKYRSGETYLLKTVRYIYAILIRNEVSELVRFKIKGTSLRDEVGEDDRAMIGGRMGLSSYIKTLTAGNDYIFSHYTNLGVQFVSGKVDHYAIVFTKGERLNSAEEKNAIEKLTELYTDLKAYDDSQEESYAKGGEIIGTVTAPSNGRVPYDIEEADKMAEEVAF